MLIRLFAVCGLLFSLVHAQGADAAAGAPQSEWKTLFNGRDFAGWDKYLSTPNGAAPIVPNDDPRNVFTITNLNGEAVIRVSGEVYGAITTKETFENFHFRVDFRWGEKRWEPRATVARDTGILYCATGQPNPGTGWMTSVENNIMEKGVGQWWSVNGAIIDVEGEFITAANELFIPYKKEGPGEQNIVWKKGAPRLTASPANGITPPFDVEQVFGNWNRVEVVYWGGHCIHILNGHVNTVVVNPRHKVGDSWRPLHEGKIQLQSEAAEVFFRNIEVKPIYELPREFMREALSPVVGKDGFTPLLTAAQLNHWKQAGSGKFTVENGVATGAGGMGLWWHSARPYTNFVLRGEFMQEQANADSGVFVRFPQPGNDPWVAVKQGHEVEIGDDPAGRERAWKTGALYPFQPRVENASRPPGEWNEYEIVCREHDYSVRLNGKLVTTWTDHTRRSKAGYIGLQNYKEGQTVRHRNLRVKELP
ncbi:MAG TPA: DUF1080 domain-containing protein [Methylomirabilota bacterium]|nr:DUF1080 domain-containing protein [Methylomirabilota bacterium]